eukprot:TRINITY_DN87643_c0_g1_i1.p1 TRINITY_DN87643_c0_g1~~TRINITY_DN87643_c0_g1_i1.p1  ORF type:complete len:151 (-),score=27.79 TRINITY_DN87643_c0_g1_i1:104-556(-)
MQPRSSKGGARLLATSLVLVVIASFSWLNQSPTDFNLMCQDNSGAYNLKVMGVVGKGLRVHQRDLSPGDVVVVVGRTGGIKNKVLRAIVTRMRKVSINPLGNGFSTAFDTNCAVVVDKECNPVGSKILGKIDPKCALKWPKLAQLASAGS